ncbi:hypothetical protein Y1Q_0020370 [Alligator mississippiensis]|uniref:Uncharacterized protein n=1 Tax=Alligator mississippiensis TaxID=8496 RepID=A0A151N6E0_ALLMI|nr:hypothetical protein Y1Q_0020370 [Alligator mississippiensis]
MYFEKHTYTCYEGIAFITTTPSYVGLWQVRVCPARPLSSHPPPAHPPHLQHFPAVPSLPGRSQEALGVSRQTSEQGSRGVSPGYNNSRRGVRPLASATNSAVS